MSSMIRRCLAMTVGAAALAALLLVAGVPGALLLGLAPAVVCLGMLVIIGHGAADGDNPYRTARAAADRAEAQVDDAGGPR